jgi:hypothetical protein
MTERKKKLLEKFSNVQFEYEIQHLFGEGSSIKINKVEYIRSRKTYLIDSTIHVSDVDYAQESYPMGLEFIISESCNFLNFIKSPIILTSIDIK